MRLAAVILAAGKGTRMKSEVPKVLHQVCGLPMVGHVLRAAQKVGTGRMVIVVGHGADLVEQEIKGKAEIVFQHEQLGTAHALQQVEKSLYGFVGDVLVLCGDTPLISADTLKNLILAHRTSGAAATVLTAVMEDASGYGRVVRSAEGRVIKIVEQKDASPEELLVKEINSGIYCFKSKGLFNDLAQLKPDNSQGEFYLPDLIGKYVKENRPVAAVSVMDRVEIMGVNDRSQLAMTEAIMRSRINRSLMVSGITMLDPATVYVDADVEIGHDTIIYPNTIIRGKSVIGEGCVIGPFTHIVSSRLRDNITVRQSVIDDSDIGSGCSIGPYSYIRPGCVLGSRVKVGDFVELKKTQIGTGSKVPHLSYVGDAVLGEKVNIGAGTITCNYDGENKWTTVIGNNAFIGSNTNLVAPVRVGSGASTGAGSTISKDVPDGALGITREKQKNIPNWSKRKKILKKL